ncbi:MAG: glycosyltransferase family 20 protein [Anaerolineae bacterium]
MAAQTQGDTPLIVIASNRGPFSFQADEDGVFAARRGAGGLVTALGALAERHEVLWVAAAMSEDDRAWAQQHGDRVQQVDGIYLRLVRPDPARYEGYYNVIANPLLWFIQHQLWDIPRSPAFTRETWMAWQQGYVPINRLFADAIAESLPRTDRPVLILPQDYHLYLVPHFLRGRLGRDVQIQPFIHIPWPGPDAWRILPEQMRTPLLTSLLASDRVGFQTQKDAFNFVQTCRFYLPDAHSHGARDAIYFRGRKVEAKAYPISVDVEKVEALVEEPQTRLLKDQLISFIGDRQLILRVDRVEPSKNILRGLQAYRALLEQHPEHCGQVVMLALLVPSRMEVTEYQDYLREIMAEAGLINADYSDEFWEPVRIVVGDNYPRAIAAMELYDVLLVNPIADGMNLVAKEGVLVNRRDGVLLLSEHAGAFYELGRHALSVSPFDLYGAAEAMHTALTMPREERAQRAAALRDIVREGGVRRWFADQVEDGLAAIRASSSQRSSSSTSPTPSASRSADS